MFHYYLPTTNEPSIPAIFAWADSIYDMDGLTCHPDSCQKRMLVV